MNLEQFQKQGNFLMLALDHRESLLKMLGLNPADPDAEARAIDFKRSVITPVQDKMSGLLIDADYGLSAYTNRMAPFLLPLEKSGYSDQAGERLTELQYAAGELKELGAGGAKLLIYFNPSAASAQAQMATAKRALDDAHTAGLPLFLEIVTYQPDGSEPNKAKLVPASVQMFLDQGIRPDVFKLEYPVDQAVSAQITQLLGTTPWIVLTGGQDFETFYAQLAGAKQAGAKGFLAGRALWQEACKLQGDQLMNFATSTLVERFNQCAQVFDQLQTS